MGKGNLDRPLLEDHCMKSVKSIEVSYNMVRYGDPINQYVDWHATADNPKGRLGTIFAYESPLSAYLLAGFYLFGQTTDFDTRVVVARYYSLASLIGAYLLFWGFVFRGHLFAFIVFSFLYIHSFFASYYSTIPQAETYSLVYQALFIVLSARLLQSKRKIGCHIATLSGLVGLLVLGGKMNYFIIAFPTIACFPFFCDKFKGIRIKLFYYTFFFGIALGALLALHMSPGFNLTQAFIYVVKGNKPIIQDNLWVTFIDGFEEFPAVWRRTRADFGTVAFWGGALGSVYVFCKFIYLSLKRRKSCLSMFESAQIILFLIVVGHSLNYVLLRNLFIPHRYYVVPIYTVFCLTLTVLVADAHSFFIEPSIIKRWLTSKGSGLGDFVPGRLRQIIRNRFGLLGISWRLGLVLFVLGFGLHYLSAKIMRDDVFRGLYVHALKYFGSSESTSYLHMSSPQFASSLTRLGNAALFAMIVAVPVTAIACVSEKIYSHRIVLAVARFLDSIKLNTLSISFATALITTGLFVGLKNTELLYNNSHVRKETIQLAKAIEKVRKDTAPGSLVLCWKPCIAFYADKRSIMKPVEQDLDFYIENDIHSLLGPVQPLNLYYDQLEKYHKPVTYYKLKESGEIECIRRLRLEEEAGIYFEQPVSNSIDF
jgi:hypothetical protein